MEIPIDLLKELQTIKSIWIVLHKQLDLFINPVVRIKALNCQQGYIELFMIVNICHEMQEKAGEKNKAQDVDNGTIFFIFLLIKRNNNIYNK